MVRVSSERTCARGRPSGGVWRFGTARATRYDDLPVKRPGVGGAAAGASVAALSRPTPCLAYARSRRVHPTRARRSLANRPVDLIDDAGDVGRLVRSLIGGVALHEQPSGDLASLPRRRFGAYLMRPGGSVGHGTRRRWNRNRRRASRMEARADLLRRSFYPNCTVARLSLSPAMPGGSLATDNASRGKGVSANR